MTVYPPKTTDCLRHLAVRGGVCYDKKKGGVNMKRIVWKTIVRLLAAALVCTALVMGNAFLGNPVSALLARGAAQRYVAEEYSHLDLTIDRVAYNFKFGNYYAKVSSPTSPDTYFTIDISMLGRVERDTYESVTGGYNTWNRVNGAYRALVKEKTEGGVFPYTVDVLSGDLMGSGYDVDWIEEYGLQESELEVDGQYDILELGQQHGGIYLSVWDEDVSYERGSEILLHAAQFLEQKGIPFHAIDFMLRRPKPEDGGPYDDVVLWLLDFPADEISAPGLAERVRTAHERTMEYFGEENRIE